VHLLPRRPRDAFEPALQQPTEQPQQAMTVGRRQLGPQRRRLTFAQRRGGTAPLMWTLNLPLFPMRWAR
jgi:hypothetical protein